MPEFQACPPPHGNGPSCGSARLRGHVPYGKDRRAISCLSRLLKARCRSSVVEHSLGKGEVVCSIHTGSTTKTKQIKCFSGGALPFPPIVDRERNVFPPAKLGENPGNLFAGCSRRFA